MSEIIKKLGEFGIIPVIVIDDAETAVPLGQALINGGLPCAEITFRTAAAAEAIQKMSDSHPDIYVGAGTILTVEQAATAVAAGAKFIVTPGFDAAVVDWCIVNDVPITPGVMTPTEINMALNKGVTLVKFFPAEAAGGIKVLEAIAAPYGGVTFIPTGGVSIANLADYLSLRMVHACGGSWVATKQLINAGEFEKIEKLTAESVQLVQQIRGK